MSALGKVLLVFVFLASVGFLYVAARAIKIHEVFRSSYNEHVKALADREKRIKELNGSLKDESPKDEQGKERPDGFSQLTKKLNLLVAAQGQVWRDCPLAG